MNRTCMAVERNDPLLEYLGPHPENPNNGALLAEYLPGNTYVKILELESLYLTEPIAQALAQAICDTQIQRLCMTRRLLVTPCPGTEESKRIRQILCHGICSSTTIQTISFVDTPNDEADVVAHLLSGFSRLSKLKLEFDNMPLEMARFLARRMPEMHLDRLAIYVVTGERQLHVPQILEEGLLLSPTIQELEIYDFLMYQPSTWEDFISRLRSFTVRRGFSNSIQGSEVALLLHNVLIRTLSLSRLSICEFHIEDIDFHQVAEALSRNTSLTSLELRCCELPMGFGLHAARANELVHSIVHHPTLQMLDLKNNVDIGLDGIRMIAEELGAHRSRLNHICLNSCIRWYCVHDGQDLSSQLRDRLLAQDKARDQAEQAMLQYVRQNPYIHSIGLLQCCFRKTVTDEILFYTSLNQLGRHLLSQDHGLPSSVWAYILAQCQAPSKVSPSSLTYYFLREQPHLVQR